MAQKHYQLIPSFLLSLALLFATYVRAGDLYYVGPDNGLWSDPNNWSLTDGGPGGAGPPPPSSNSGDHVYITPSTATTVIFDGNYSQTSRLPTVQITGGSNFTVTLQQSTGVDSSVNETVGPGAIRTFNAGDNSILHFSATGDPINHSIVNFGGDFVAVRTTTCGFMNATVFQTKGSVGADSVVGISGNTIYNLSGGVCGGDSIQMGGSAIFNQSGGTTSAFFALQLAGSCVYNLSGGTVNFPAGETLTTFNQTGGVNQANNGGGGFINAASYSISAGSVTCGTLTASQFTQSGGTADAGNDVILTNVAALTGGSLSAARFLIQGSFQQSGGNLTTHNPTKEINISASGSYALSGGSLSSNTVINNGVFSLTTTASTTLAAYSQSATASLGLELDGNTPNLYAHLNPSTSASLAGDLTLTLANDFSPSPGDTFLLIDSPSLTGTFSSYHLPPLSPGLDWQPTYTPTTFSLSVVTPEPVLSFFPILLLLIRSRSSRE